MVRPCESFPELLSGVDESRRSPCGPHRCGGTFFSLGDVTSHEYIPRTKHGVTEGLVVSSINRACNMSIAR